MDWESDFTQSYPSEYAEGKLDEFCEVNGVSSKGKLSVVAQLTRLASEADFPLQAGAFRTETSDRWRG